MITFCGLWSTRMSVNDHDEELYLALQEIDLDEKSPAYGISMQVLHQSYASLNAKQKYVYDTKMAPLLRRQAERDEVNRLREPF
jgi:hypothetical protein